MLWILSGSYHSGKNTFRNILAEEYGFKIIDKYILEETLHGEGDIRLYNDTEKENERRARRDPYLVVARGERERLVLESQKNMTDETVSRVVEKDDKIIYDKGINTDGYIIYTDALSAAVLDDCNNYLLVCSNPNVIGKILRVKTINENLKRVRTIMIFGFHLEEEISLNESQRKIKLKIATDKIQEFFSSKDYLKRFNYLIFNRPCDLNVEERTKNLIIQWENALGCDSEIEKKMIPIRLRLEEPKQIEEPKRISSSIFFIKPFPSSMKSENYNKERDTIVYNGINSIATECNREVHTNYNSKSTYSLGANYPIKTVVYTDPTYPQDQMRKQIDDAGLVVADVATVIDNKIEYKPNCFWEIGYARAKNKQIILIADPAAFPLPFDESDAIALPYVIDNAKIEMCPNTTKLSFKDELQKYFDKLKRAVENRNFHLSLIEAAKKGM